MCCLLNQFLPPSNSPCCCYFSPGSLLFPGPGPWPSWRGWGLETRNMGECPAGPQCSYPPSETWRREGILYWRKDFLRKVIRMPSRSAMFIQYTRYFKKSGFFLFFFWHLKLRRHKFVSLFYLLHFTRGRYKSDNIFEGEPADKHSLCNLEKIFFF